MKDGKESKDDVSCITAYDTYEDMGYGYRLYSLEEEVKEGRYYYAVCVIGTDCNYYTPAGREVRVGDVAELGTAWEGNHHFVRSMFFGVGLCGCDVWLVDENRNELQDAEPVFYDHKQALDYASGFIHRRKPMYMSLRKMMDLSKDHIEHFIDMPGNFITKDEKDKHMKMRIVIVPVKVCKRQSQERIIEWQSQRQVNYIIPVVMAQKFSAVEKHNHNPIKII